MPTDNQLTLAKRHLAQKLEKKIKAKLNPPAVVAKNPATASANPPSQDQKVLTRRMIARRAGTASRPQVESQAAQITTTSRIENLIKDKKTSYALHIKEIFEYVDVINENSRIVDDTDGSKKFVAKVNRDEQTNAIVDAPEDEQPLINPYFEFGTTRLKPADGVAGNSTGIQRKIDPSLINTKEKALATAKAALRAFLPSTDLVDKLDYEKDVLAIKKIGTRIPSYGIEDYNRTNNNRLVQHSCQVSSAIIEATDSDNLKTRLESLTSVANGLPGLDLKRSREVRDEISSDSSSFESGNEKFATAKSALKKLFWDNSTICAAIENSRFTAASLVANPEVRIANIIAAKGNGVTENDVLSIGSILTSAALAYDAEYLKTVLALTANTENVALGLSKDRVDNLIATIDAIQDADSLDTPAKKLVAAKTVLKSLFGDVAAINTEIDALVEADLINPNTEIAYLVAAKGSGVTKDDVTCVKNILVAAHNTYDSATMSGILGLRNIEAIDAAVTAVDFTTPQNVEESKLNGAKAVLKALHPAHELNHTTQIDPLTSDTLKGYARLKPLLDKSGDNFALDAKYAVRICRTFNERTVGAENPGVAGIATLSVDQLPDINGRKADITAAIQSNFNDPEKKLAAKKSALRELFSDLDSSDPILRKIDALTVKETLDDFLKKLEMYSILKDYKSHQSAVEELKKENELTIKRGRDTNTNPNGGLNYLEEAYLKCSEGISSARADLISVIEKDEGDIRKEIELRALSHQQEDRVGKTHIPELRDVRLKTEQGVQAVGQVPERPTVVTLTFQNKEDAVAFNRRFRDRNASFTQNNSTITFDQNSPTTVKINFPHTKTVDRAVEEISEEIDNQEVTKERRNKESRLDRGTKTLIGNALSILGPTIPMACYYAGRGFQALHSWCQFGSIPARVLLQAAELGLKNPVIPNKDIGATDLVDTTLNTINKSLKNIDSAEGGFFDQAPSIAKAVSSIPRQSFAVVFGVTGAALNLISGVMNWAGDSCLSGSRACAENTGIGPSGLLFGIGAVVTFAGASVLKPVGLATRALGSALSHDVMLYKGSNSPATMAAALATWADKFAIDKRFFHRDSDKDAIPKNFNVEGEKIETDPALEEIRKNAKEIFKKIRSPQFTRSGIENDPREYCRVAQVYPNNHSFELLFCPEDGSICIASPIKRLNRQLSSSDWNDVRNISDRDDFAKLVEKALSLDGTKNRHYEDRSDLVHGGKTDSITRAPDGRGITYEEFLNEKNKALDALAQNSKAPSLKNFKFRISPVEGLAIAAEQYEVVLDKFENMKMYRRAGDGVLVELSEMEEFKVINRVYERNSATISNSSVDHRDGNAPQANSVKNPIARKLMGLTQALAEAESKSSYVRK